MCSLGGSREDGGKCDGFATAESRTKWDWTGEKDWSVYPTGPASVASVEWNVLSIFVQGDAQRRVNPDGKAAGNINEPLCVSRHPASRGPGYVVREMQVD